MTDGVSVERSRSRPAWLAWTASMRPRVEISRLQLVTAAVTLAFSLLVCGILAFSVASNSRAARQKQETETGNLAQTLNRHLTAAFQLVDHTLRQGRTEWLETHRLRDHRDFYSNFPNFKTMIIQVAIIDASGMLLATSIDPHPQPVDLSDRPHFKAHVGATADRLFVSQPVIGRVSKRSTVQFSRPVFTPDGQFDGVVIASVDTSFLENFFGGAPLDTLSFGLIGEDGVKRLWYGTTALIPPQALGPRVASLPAMDARQGHFSTPAIAGQPETTWYVQPMRDFPMRVVVGTNQSALLKEIRNTELLALGLAVFLLVSAGAAAAYMIRAIHVKNQVLRALRESQLKANSANAMKSRFVADISHELRTPLNGILGFSELISRSTDIQKMTRYGELINGSAKHLHQLVNTMLDLAKIEAGKMEITRTICDLREVCESVAGIHRYAAEKKEILLSINYAANLPATMYTDRIKLMQILNNLLHNAVKFTAKGCVFLHVAQSQDRWIFRVADTGIGMTPPQLARLFDRFSASHAEAQTIAREQGSGLGMALCRDLVELLGGRVQASSTPDVGTVMEIFLPIAPEDRHGTPD